MRKQLRLFPLLAVLIALSVGVASQAGDYGCRYRRHHEVLPFEGINFFFESNEPTFDEIPKDDILDLFPEGKYKFVGLTIEGDKLLGSAKLTHDIPGAPVILTPEEDDIVDPEDVVVTWSKVTTPASINIESYQIIVTNDEDPQFEYNVRLPADATSLSVPAEFFAPDTEYELEILAVEESGNQTISVIFFRTE
jgi:hypothetical protein